MELTAAVLDVLVLYVIRAKSKVMVQKTKMVWLDSSNLYYSKTR